MAKNITVKIGDQLQNFQGVEFLKLQTVGSQGDTSFVDQDAVSVLPFTFKFDANGQHNEENIALYQKYKNCVERGLSVNTYINWEGALYPASSIPELNKIYAYTDIGPLDIIEITFGETVQNNIIEVIDTVFDEEKGNPASQQAIAEWVKKYVSKNGGGGAVTDEQITAAVESYFEENPVVAEETDPTVPAWAKEPTKPTYTASEVGALPDTYTPPDQTAEQVGADPKGTADSKVSAHNTSNASHNDIRLLIEGLAEEIDNLTNTEDKVEYIVPTFTQKAYVSISGTVIASNEEYAYTEKIPVKEGQIIRPIVVSTSTGGKDKYLNFTTITAYVDGVVNSSLGVNGVGNFVYDYIVPKSVTEIVVSAKFFNSAYSNQRVEITTPATKSLISLGFVRNDYSFSLPKKFYLRNGQTAEIYLRNITNPNYLVRLGNYTNATTIRASEDCVKITGNSAADKPISYVVYDNHFNPIEDGEMTLSILGTVPASQKMLLIGDSFIATSGGYFGSCLRDLFTADGNTLTLLGTQGSDPKKHEGYSGKKYTDFANGFSGSPFGTSGFNFSSYMSAQGYSGLNSVYIQLGTNDVSATNPNQDLSDVITAMKTIVSSIQSYSSSIKIYVGMTVMPNLDSVTFANTYNGTGFNWIMKQNMQRLNALIIKEYGESSSVKLVANNCILDNSVDILDNVHPTNAGFAKMAKQLYYTMMS